MFVLPSAFSLWYAAFRTNRVCLYREFTRIMTTKPSLKLTHEGALKALSAAIDKAQEIGVPQNITIVDEGGNMLAFVRMDGAKFLSIETSKSKALSAASHRTATGGLPAALEVKLAIASGGPADQCRGRVADLHRRRLRRRYRRRVGHQRSGRGSGTGRSRRDRRAGEGGVSPQLFGPPGKERAFVCRRVYLSEKRKPEETHADASRRLCGADPELRVECP